MHNNIIPIIYPSALSIWLGEQNANISDRIEGYRKRVIAIPSDFESPSGSEIDQVCEKYSIQKPMQIFASRRSLRKNSRRVQCSLMDAGLPSGSFISLDKLRQNDPAGQGCEIAVASPELCFLHAARYLDFIELVKLGYDLCSLYIGGTNQTYYHRSDNPVTCTEQINKYLDASSGLKGVQKARRAMRYVADNSNSPMETKVAMLEVLPFSMGGFSIEKPVLNGRIGLSEEGSCFLGRNYCICDEVWKEKRVIVEYDSNAFHLDAQQHEIDKKRSTALTLSGYKLFSITAGSMRDLGAVDNTFISLRKMLGLKTYSQKVQDTNQERRVLLKYLRSV